MYRIYKILICLVLVCGLLAGCAGSGTPETTGTTQGTTEATTETTTEATTEATTAATTEATTEVTTETTEQTVPETTTRQEPLDPVVQPPAGGASEGIFADAAFIGDSVTLKLRNYNTANGAVSGATFLCQGSYSVNHAVNNTMYLSYQGQDMTPQDALKACGAKKVFILLGMNDIALWGIDATIESWGKLVNNIRAVNPDIQIYIQSGTPIYKSGEVGSLTNENMDKYNVKLQAFAESNGCQYIDLAKYLKDPSNGLAKAYCSDDYVHFTDAACAVWVKVLQTALG